MDRWRGFLTLRFSNLMTTLTYVLMDNFCLCLWKDWIIYNDQLYNNVKELTLNLNHCLERTTLTSGERIQYNKHTTIP